MKRSEAVFSNVVFAVIVILLLMFAIPVAILLRIVNWFLIKYKIDFMDVYK